MKKRLIIAPHPDDEVIGCSSMLSLETHVLICGVVERSRGKNYPKPEAMLKEIEKASAVFGHSFEVDYHMVSGSYTMQSAIDLIETAINNVRPAELYIPHLGYHQDHRLIHEAALTAVRPHDKNHFVKVVAVYEGIFDFLWARHEFIPNMFNEVDIEKKIEAYKNYKSQVRSMRSAESIRELAGVRGRQCQLRYAEAFQVLRWLYEE